MASVRTCQAVFALTVWARAGRFFLCPLQLNARVLLIMVIAVALDDYVVEQVGPSRRPAQVTSVAPGPIRIFLPAPKDIDEGYVRITQGGRNAVFIRSKHAHSVAFNGRLYNGIDLTDHHSSVLLVNNGSMWVLLKYIPAVPAFEERVRDK
jgi:hypothetical protein